MENVELILERLSGDVILPEYAHEGDACMDLRVLTENGEDVTIPARGHHTFGTGLKANIPTGYVLEVHPRSGLGIKKGVTLRNVIGVIDSNFTSEIKVCLENKSDETVTISNNDRVAQFRLMPYPKMIIKEGKVEDMGRGEGLGSSGVK